MWPWEHAAVGYLSISVTVHFLWSRSPRDLEAALALFGTQFPDLVDKPLGWVFNVLPSGTSLAHSMVFAAGTCLTVGTLALLLGRAREALAFSVGYATHLCGDILYPLVDGRPPNWEVVLWPFVVTDIQGERTAVEFVLSLFDNFVELATAGPGPGQFLVAELAVLAVTVLVWSWDGHPGVPPYGRSGPQRL